MAKPELGNKHHCQQCGTKFFDLNRNPVLCPKCGAVQQVASARVARASAPEKEEAEADPGVELVSLDEVEVVEPNLETAVDDDVEIEDEPADDTFLEEEEEDTDDVSGLIDGEIAPDEER
ncbi:MAG TPA: TIGR02300 family protein [Methylovirgula sp.]|nr:TIGR02300 family protein [Methylovirgula sp.]